MLKQHKKTLIISSILILLPCLAGLLLWERLPGQFATHWDASWQADGWSSKGFAVFAPPLIMLVLHWVAILFTHHDQKGRNQSPKVTGMVLWIVPIISLMTSSLVYGIALGMNFPKEKLVFWLLGGMFVVMGNYMPKCRLNSTIGIKLPWTLASEENWNATHRFGGKLWFFGGFAILALSLFPAEATVTWLLMLIMVIALIPMAYSYRLYKKQQAAGTAPALPKPSRAFWIAMPIVAAFIALVLFGGSIQYEFGAESFTIDASSWNDLTVDYAVIDSVEYREEMVSGSRDNGFGSLKLLLGIFSNEEFGSFTRYTYTGSDSCIVLTAGEKILVISGKDSAETAALYASLLEKLPE